MEELNELALLAGAGGGILGGKLLGWHTVCAVECDAYAAQVLAQRQNDRCLEPFPIWSDVCSFDGRPWRGIVDVISGGFPCQDISAAGKGAGITGARSGLWKEFARIIGEVRPRWVFAENSPLLRTRGLEVVLQDLAALGYDAEWCVLGASDVGAPHKRERIWLLGMDADSHDVASWTEEPGVSEGSDTHPRGVGHVSNAYCYEHQSQPHARVGQGEAKGTKVLFTAAHHAGLEERDGRTGSPRSCSPAVLGDWWSVEPTLGRVAHGVGHRVDRLRAIGNGQVPAVAATAFQLLKARF